MSRGPTSKLSETYDLVVVDLSQFESAYDLDFFKRYNLGGVTYFNEEVFGKDKVVLGPRCGRKNRNDDGPSRGQ